VAIVKAISSVVVGALVTLVLVGRALAGGPSMTIGVVDDAVRQPTVAAARAKLALVRGAGFDSVSVTEAWTQGETAPPAGDVAALRNVFAAARSLRMRVIVSIYPAASSQTPLTAGADNRFAAFAVALARSVGAREFMIGNEPNLNRFWLPQFGPGGSDTAAPAYLRLLARAHDALKAFNPHIVVDGGAVSPRGGDRASGLRKTHSPTEFVEDLGSAYRASRRKRPVMDAFDIHPYEDNSSVPPTTSHPRSRTISIADYDKLVALLGRAFDGTAQAGSTLPIVYGEFGVETRVPPSKRRFYTGTEPATTRPVGAITQGRFYREAIALAFCQPNVRTLLLFHAFDEPSRVGWQSGVFYADGTAKPSLPIVREAIRNVRQGTIARCSGLALRPRGARSGRRDR
jgi:hypothetical protein